MFDTWLVTLLCFTTMGCSLLAAAMPHVSAQWAELRSLPGNKAATENQLVSTQPPLECDD